MNIQDLIKTAIVEPQLDPSFHFEFVKRSRSEHSMMHDTLNAKGVVIDIRKLYVMPEAYAANGFPLLAIAPMRAAKVVYRRIGNSVEFKDLSTDPCRPFSIELPLPEKSHRVILNLEAPVPFVPKKLDPGYWQRKKHYILFDSDWSPVPRSEDPYLLRRLSTNQFEIVAHWDLTSIEKHLIQIVAGS